MFHVKGKKWVVEVNEMACQCSQDTSSWRACQSTLTPTAVFEGGQGFMALGAHKSSPVLCLRLTPEPVVLRDFKVLAHDTGFLIIVNTFAREFYLHFTAPGVAPGKINSIKGLKMVRRDEALYARNQIWIFAFPSGNSWKPKSNVLM